MSNTTKDKYKLFTVEHKLVEDLPDNAKIIGFIQNGKASVDRLEKKETYSTKTLKNATVYYPICSKRPNFYKIKGYILANENENEWLGYCDNRSYFIFFLLSLGIFLSSSIACVGVNYLFQNDSPQVNSKTNNKASEKPSEETTVERGDGVSNLDDLLQSDASTHTLSVPQFSELYITQSTYIPLINLPQNDILMMYEVYTLDNKLVFASKEPILPNSEDKWYLSNYDKGDYDFIIRAYKVDSEGNKGNSVSFNTTIHIQ